MKIDVISYRDDSDGGGSVDLDLDDEAIQYLIERGFNSLLKDALKLMNNETENERKTN